MTTRQRLQGKLLMSDQDFHLIDAGGIVWLLDIAPALAGFHVNQQVALRGLAYNTPRFSVFKLIER